MLYAITYGKKLSCSIEQYSSWHDLPHLLSPVCQCRKLAQQIVNRSKTNMGKKKRGHPDIEEQLARPWCYYCERDFDDLKILINHQKAKHFKCERCGRRLNTAGGKSWRTRGDRNAELMVWCIGLSVHMTQVHKETLTTIDNALPNRSGLDIEIFGMEGIPDDIVASHNQRVLTSFAQAEAERRAATGNPAPGSGGGSAAKKPKFESPSDLKKRLAEHKAKMAADPSAEHESGENTPNAAMNGHQSPGLGQSPMTMVGQTVSMENHGLMNLQQAGSPGYPPPAMIYGAPPGGSTFSPFQQPYGQQPAPYQQQPTSFAHQPSNFAPPGVSQFPNQQQFAPPQQFQPPPGQAFPSPFPNAPPQSYNAGSPVPFQSNQYQAPRTETPPQLPMRPGSLPPAPGLPQRPSFGAPPVNAFQMQQMHQGQIPGPSNPQDAPGTHPPGALTPHGRPPGSPPSGGSEGQFLGAGIRQGSGLVGLAGSSDNQGTVSAHATSLEDLISGAAKEVDKSEAKQDEPQEERKGKKEKDKSTRLIYSDNNISPEEKMAQMSRYAFAPSGRAESLSGGAQVAATTVTTGAEN